jgi:hypothetical protein
LLLLNPNVLSSRQFPTFFPEVINEVLHSYTEHFTVIHINFDSEGRKTWRWDALNLNGSVYILHLCSSYFTILFCYWCSPNPWTLPHFNSLWEILMIIFYFQANQTRQFSINALNFTYGRCLVQSQTGNQLFWLRLFIVFFSPFRKVLR